MPQEIDRALLTLSLEVAAAKESPAALEAFRLYLAGRFGKAVDKGTDTPDSHGTSFFVSKEGGFHFHLPFPEPVCLRVSAGEQPSAFELQALEQIALSFREKVSAMAELKSLSHTDDLTGLFNQRYLEIVLEREISLAKRNDTEFSVLFLDLDHFKNVNDSHGHLIGSRLLSEVGQEIKGSLRDSDVTFRYGGDEFVIILSHTGLDDAIFVAERMRQQIERKIFLAKDGLNVRLTASIGVATVPLHASTKQQILKAADEALYGVKKAVRNRVIAATSPVKE